MYSRIGDDSLAMFWALLTKSITTKIDTKHDREAVARIIEQAQEASRLLDKQTTNDYQGGK
jgi:hypothetical protein